MNYKIKFISRDELVEESFWIQVGGIAINVFCNDYNFKFELLGEYQVELEFNIFDEYKICESSLTPQVRKLDHSFAYEIIGVLENGTLTVGDFSIFDEILLSNYGYLDDKNISWIVDRIDMSIDW
ncbi:hypothetical protein [Acinetobacter piscicola]|uniref:hypothetical protein n=1 Tax=Acinetobacter piscicola TaxID=2006115 RepID=UPI000B7D8FA1|nr:hypothetical protein [Acinetobacter piscicola]